MLLSYIKQNKLIGYEIGGKIQKNEIRKVRKVREWRGQKGLKSKARWGSG